MNLFIVCRKIGNSKKITELLVASEEWEEAFQWVEKHPEFKELVYLPFATSLAEQDKFLQAQKGAYDKFNARFVVPLCLIYCSNYDLIRV